MTQLSLEQKKAKYGEDLLEWYFHIQRNLPWRENHDPYRIWVSEIMLQQTRVDTVIPYFLSFIEKFPTIQHLAEAPEEEVLKSWEGLGYYSRARNLQAGAKMVMEQHQGQVPTTKEEVAALKGVGPYTCGAIMSIAYNEPVPAVDGNVMRVISRFFALEDDIAKPSTRVKLEKLVETMIPEGQARYFNQALMELGALICTPKSPSCLLCPVMDNCEARLQGREHELPLKSKAKKARVEYRAAVIVEGQGEHEGKVLVRQRPSDGLLAGMWELPHVLVEGDQAALYAEQLKEQPLLGQAISEEMHKRHGLLVKPREWFCDQDHIFSHIRWNMRFFLADSSEVQSHVGEDVVQTIAHTTAQTAAAAERTYSTDQIDPTDHIDPTDIMQNVTTEAKLVAESTEDYRAITAQEINMTPELRYIRKEDMSTMPFPNLFLKILQNYWKTKGV
ncbi:A/G-specific adenine glycosylase [Paenibacillus septentrionalis]